MKPKSKKKPTPTKLFSKFVAEDLALQQTKNDEVGELHTDTDWKDSFRFSERLRQFREGLLALLAADDKLDDELLGRFGITKWDIPVEAHFARPRAPFRLPLEAVDPAQREVAVARKQELNAKQRVLNAKQSVLAAQKLKVQRDIAKVKE